MKQEFETPSSPVAVPYKWEAAPGRPIVEAVPAPALESWMSPLRPPPGARKPATKPLESTAFGGFEPEPPVVVVQESQLAGKILKKLNRLRRRSMVAAACFTNESLRVIENSGRMFTVEDLDGCSAYDYDTMSSGSTFDHQPGTPCSSTSLESSFSEPTFSSCTRSSTMSSSPYITRARPSSCRFEEVDEYIFDHDTASETLPGPRESAWQMQSGELAMEPPLPLPPKRPSIRRSYSTLIPTLLRQSSSARRSFKELTLGRTFRRPKATRQLDFLGNV